MDLLVNYGRPLLREQPRLSDAGDLDGYESSDTLDLTGLYLHPTTEMRGSDGALLIGAPAAFRVTRDLDGRDEVSTFGGR